MDDNAQGACFPEGGASMTRKDFQRIAGVLAYAEAHCDDDRETETVRWIAGLFGDFPGFVPSRFAAAALPIKHREAR